VPVENLTPQAVRTVRFAQVLAGANQAKLTLLHVCERRTSPSQMAWIESQLSLMVSKWAPPGKAEIQIHVKPHADVAKAILNASDSADLVVLRSLPRLTSAGTEIGDFTTQLVQQLTCSVVMLGEPQRRPAGVLLNPPQRNTATPV
jgi:nucleotide-binding universal stress UspA family protein